MPANFVKPRESKPVANPRKRRALVYAALAIIAVLATGGLGYALISSKVSQLDELTARKNQLNQQIKNMEPEIKYMEALREWRETAIPWLDELYDLTARSPDNEPGFRISNISISPWSPPKTSSKDKDTSKDKENRVTARMLVQCTVPMKKDDLVFKLKDKINRDPHCLCSILSMKATGTTNDQKIEVTLQIDIIRQQASQYNTRLVLKQPTRSGKVPDGGQ
jgi:hypothetical protein